MNTVTLVGKYLDQPRLVKKFSNAVPAILVAGATAYTINNVNKSPDSEKGKEFIKSVAVLTATIASALIAPKLSKAIIDNFYHGHEHEHEVELTLSQLKDRNTALINDFIKNNKIEDKISTVLEKVKSKILNFGEIKTLFGGLSKKVGGKKLLSELIPDPENIDSKHIFGEIGRLSLLGLFPVVGGISGGIVGDKLTEPDWREKVPDKIKEGTYQYLANIFLCNIGAGVALLGMEKAKITSKAARVTGMVSGIILTGVIGGSAIANFIGKKFIDPLFGNKTNSNNLYDERTPEVIDIGLHVDDLATVAVMSGLKWIEPALPITYSISGYRAGIGYRNENKQEK